MKRKGPNLSKITGTDDLRLQVYLSQCGLGSRRQCEEYILEGLVEVNGEKVTRLGSRVDPEDDVRYRGKKVFQTRKHIYIALHKPQGYICSSEDQSNRPLVYDLIKNVVAQRVFTVGRLDYMSSGLILLTNDGDFTQKIIHPGSRIEKEYSVVTTNEIPADLMESFKRGIHIEGERFKLKDYKLISPRKVTIILEEGKNREIRKVFISRNLKIKKIHRIRIGNLTMGNLAPGHFRYLKDPEVAMLLKSAAGDKSSSKAVRRDSRD
jgi:23S rRNA pseudouridine2605 synthase